MKFLLLPVLLAITPLALAAASQNIPMQIAVNGGTLHGTLEIPAGKGPFPVALIIAGSGPTDQNGNDAQLGLNTDCYKLLAESLAQHGIASLRYDKRGAGDDLLMALPENNLRFETYIGDAVAWAKQLRRDPRFTTLTMIGHSEGSLIGMIAARQIPTDGFVSIAGAGESAAKILLTQLKPKLPPDLYRQSQAIIASLERGHPVATVPSSLQVLFRPSVQPYLISWFKYDPAKEITAIGISVLIVQGERDLQVSVGNARILAKADPTAKLVLIPDMNHVLKDVGPTVEDNLAAYTDPRLPLDNTLATSISAFIAQLQPERSISHGHE